jgi:hypothetical protein
MSGKVIDLDPNKRLSKEALDIIKDFISGLDVDGTSSITIIHTPSKGGSTSVQAYGMDFYSIGIAQTILFSLGQEILRQEYASRDD